MKIAIAMTTDIAVTPDILDIRMINSVIITAILHTVTTDATRTSIMVTATVAKAITTNRRLVIGYRHIKFGGGAFG